MKKKKKEKKKRNEYNHISVKLCMIEFNKFYCFSNKKFVSSYFEYSFTSINIDKGFLIFLKVFKMTI